MCNILLTLDDAEVSARDGGMRHVPAGAFEVK